MSNPIKEFVGEVDAYIRRTNCSPTAFGLAAVKDSKFVPAIRNGREPRHSQMERVRKFMATNPDGPPKKKKNGK